MKFTHRLAATAALLGTLAGVQAAPVTYDFTLQATGIGNVLPVFGISALPAGPFFGSFSFDGPLAPNASFAPVTLTAFSATVGDVTWTLSDVTSAAFSTDAAGAIDPDAFFVNAEGNSAGWLRMGRGQVTNLGWFALDMRAPTLVCYFDIDPPYVGPIGGSCIGGGPDTITLTQRPAQVPVPGTLALGALALAALGAMRRRAR